MKKNKVILLQLFLFLIAYPPWSSEKFMPLKQIKPGMKGVARTVFSGTAIEEFGVEVLEIVENYSPQKDIIMVRLTGPTVEKTGVVGGMSGSPVYIDGKLVGAIAYRFGTFQKEPIAGVTPIEQMLEIIDKEKVRPQEMVLQKGINFLPLKVALGIETNEGGDFLRGMLPSYDTSTQRGAVLSPIQIPLVFSGFVPRVVQQASVLFEKMGFITLQGGSATSDQEIDVPIQPGSAVSAVIIDGDMSVSATGTVTYCDGNRILAFGHPFLNTGPVNLPMGKARILTTLSSIYASNKFPLVTQVVGNFRQDRSTGLLGIIGEQADMMAVKVNYISPVQEKKTFFFRVAEERSLGSITPLYLRLALMNAIESARLAGGDYNLSLKGKILLKDYPDIVLDNFYAGYEFSEPGFVNNDIFQASEDVASVVASLLMNDFQVPEIQGIELSFNALPGRRCALVEHVWYDKAEVEQGEIITLAIFLRPYHGEVVRYEHQLKIPRDVPPGNAIIVVGCGSLITKMESRVVPGKYRPENFQQLVKLLNKRRKNNTLFIQLKVRDKGVFIKGQELADLPPSVLAVMNSGKSAGGFQYLRERVVAEHQIPLDYALFGGKTIRIKIRETKKF